MTLDIYPVVLELVRRLAPYLPRLRSRSASLGDQMERALISIPLNVAEAIGTQTAKCCFGSCCSAALRDLRCADIAERMSKT